MPQPKAEAGSRNAEAGKAGAAGKEAGAAGKPDERTPDEKDFARAMMEEQGFAEAPPAEEKPPEPSSAAVGEADGATEGAPEAGAEEPPKEPDEGKEKDGDADKGGLPPELQEKIDKRIGKEVHRRKETEELLEAERTLTKELTARVSELEEQGRAAPAGGGAINPLLMAETDAELNKREDYLWQVEEFCEEHIDGYEAEKPGEQSYTAAEIRRRLLEVRRERERDLPRARETLKRRTAYEAVTREAYPELADPRSELSVEAARWAARIPGVKALPEYKLVLGDLLAGRKAREGKAKGQPKPAARPAPPVPGAPVPPRSGVQQPGKPKGRSTMETFAEGGFSDDALAKALD